MVPWGPRRPFRRLVVWGVVVDYWVFFHVLTCSRYINDNQTRSVEFLGSFRAKRIAPGLNGWSRPYLDDRRVQYHGTFISLGIVNLWELTTAIHFLHCPIVRNLCLLVGFGWERWCIRAWGPWPPVAFAIVEYREWLLGPLTERPQSHGKDEVMPERWGLEWTECSLC